MQLKIITKYFIRTSEDFNTFTAVIMEPEVDLHGDIASEEEIKKACHNYTIKQQMQSKIQHEKPTDQIALVETYILEEPKIFGSTEVKKGSWVGKFQVFSEELKDKILSGLFSGVSIGGIANVTDAVNKSIDNPHKDKPLRYLKDIEINEISLVDYPANNKTILKLEKSKGYNMKLDEVVKAVAENPEYFEELEKRFKGNKNDENNIDSEELLKKNMGESFYKKYQENQSRLVALEKILDENEKISYKQRISSILNKSFNVDETALDSIYKISKAHPLEYKYVEKLLKDASNTIQNLNKMDAIGVDHHDDNNITKEDRIYTNAKSIAKKENISFAVAFEKSLRNFKEGNL